MLTAKIEEYVAMFGEGIPVFQLPSMTEAELIALIDEHLKSGRPIVPEEDPDVVY